MDCSPQCSLQGPSQNASPKEGSPDGRYHWASARPLICGEGQDSSKRIDVLERIKADAAESPRRTIAAQPRDISVSVRHFMERNDQGGRGRIDCGGNLGVDLRSGSNPSGLVNYFLRPMCKSRNRWAPVRKASRGPFVFRLGGGFCSSSCEGCLDFSSSFSRPSRA